MKIKDIKDENYQDYKIASMFICTNICDGKCWRDLGLDCSICQNEQIMHQPTFDIPNEAIIKRYLENDLTHAIVFGGLEPMLQLDELIAFISELRRVSRDTVVVYTGYNEQEIEHKMCLLRKYENIIIKFGRYIPNQEKKYDEILGVYLASPNQYAKQIS